jgi:EAL domain-containing protein (putative c-di-GMP-specific phosphodiesterase class I)
MAMTGRLPADTSARAHRSRLRSVSPYDLRIALQPIISVSTGAVVAVEALARFADRANTEAVFDEARANGRAVELEAWCLQAALRRRADLAPGVQLAVNISPNALPYLDDRAVWSADLRGVIVEITEHEVHDPDDLQASLNRLRERGAAIAIDDVSTGYAGLLRLAQMAPDFVKIDRQVVTGVGENAVQAAVLEALVTLSHRLGAAVIGEGVESFADLAALSDYDVDHAQGFAIARPAATVSVAPEVEAACRSNRRRVLGGIATRARDVARTRDLYAVTAALASADQHRDIDAAITATARDLGVDLIGVSLLSPGMYLTEIASTGVLDPSRYLLADYPATLSVMTTRHTLEVQLSDPGADDAERDLMRRLGHSSMLVVPMVHDGRAIGIVEFAQNMPRRWTAQDVAHARGLAAHLTPVVRRLGPQDGGPAAAAPAV